MSGTLVINQGDGGSIYNLTDDSSPPLAADTPVSGDFYSMLTFESASPSLEIVNKGTPALPAFSAFLLSCWMKLSSNATQAVPLNTSLSGEIMLVSPTVNELSVNFIGSDGLVNYLFDKPGDWTDGNYHHYLLSADTEGKLANLAFDGTLFAPVSVEGTSSINTNLLTVYDLSSTSGEDGLGDLWFAPTDGFVELTDQVIAAFYNGGPVNPFDAANSIGIEPLLLYTGTRVIIFFTLTVTEPIPLVCVPMCNYNPCP